MRHTDPIGMQVKDSTVEKTINPVVVTGSKPDNANPFLGTLAFSLSNFAWYEQQVNNAFGKNNATFTENFQQAVYFLNLALAPYTRFFFVESREVWEANRR